MIRLKSVLRAHCSPAVALQHRFLSQASRDWNARKEEIEKRSKEKRKALLTKTIDDPVADFRESHDDSFIPDVDLPEEKPVFKRFEIVSEEQKKNLKRSRKKKDLLASKLVLNENIEADEFHLFDEDGEDLGTIAKVEALTMIQRKKYKKQGMAILLSDKTSTPVTCRLVTKQEQDRMASELKSSIVPKKVTKKEIMLSNRIAENDFEMKMSRVREWLLQKSPVTVTVKYKKVGPKDVLSALEENASQRTEEHVSKPQFLQAIRAMNLPHWQYDRVFRQKKNHFLGRTTLELFVDDLANRLSVMCTIKKKDINGLRGIIELEYNKNKVETLK